MRTLIGILAVAFVGCGISESNVGVNEEDPLAEGGELSASSRTFVGIRRDFRKCISPMCGGYWVHDLNRAVFAETYVSALDFSGSSLSDADQGRVQVGLDQVVLRGKLGAAEAQFNTRAFIVSEAYLGMPGLPAGAADGFYKLSAVDIQCFRAPCPTLAAKRVNRTAQTLFHSLDLSGLGHRLDLKWLSKRTIEDGAITSGVLMQNGEEISLEASNVFVRLPERAGPCPLFRPALCPSGTVRTFERTPDRCENPSACVTPGACAQFLPTCAEGYQLHSWVGGRFACPQFVCEPNWL